MVFFAERDYNEEAVLQLLQTAENRIALGECVMNDAEKCSLDFYCRSLQRVYLVLILLFNFFCVLKLQNIYDAARSTNWYTATKNPWEENIDEEQNDEEGKDHYDSTDSSTAIEQKSKDGSKDGEFPVVTIQICCYNEKEVIEATMNAACSLDWPQDKLVVQVLDDSTNSECSKLVEAVAARWRSKGIQCVRLHRPTRIGYKAGNLRHHMSAVQGEFVAFFDADNKCEPDFLQRTIPHFVLGKSRNNPFHDEKDVEVEVCMVQTPWAYYNTHKSILTEFDALKVDQTHAIELIAYSNCGQGWFCFNGTAGIWRTKTLTEAGGDGWSWATLAEDMDMSNTVYCGLAQDSPVSKKGKRKRYIFRYLRDCPQLLELPQDVYSHVHQKIRWTKGGIQALRLHFLKIMKLPSEVVSLKVKRNMLMWSLSDYVNVLSSVNLLVHPVLSYLNAFSTFLSIMSLIPVFLHVLATSVTCYAKINGSNRHYETTLQRRRRAMIVIPIDYVLSLGMCIFQTFAFCSGFASNDAEFVTTEKLGDQPAPVIEMSSGTSASAPPHQQSLSDELSGGEASNQKVSTGARLSPDATSASDVKFIIFMMVGLYGIVLGIYDAYWFVAIMEQRLYIFPFIPYRIFNLDFCFSLGSAIGLFFIHGSFVLGTLRRRFRK